MPGFSTNCFVTVFVGSLVSTKFIERTLKDKGFNSQEVQDIATHVVSRRTTKIKKHVTNKVVVNVKKRF